jgi:hypothetical protein
MSEYCNECGERHESVTVCPNGFGKVPTPMAASRASITPDQIYREAVAAERARCAKVARAQRLLMGAPLGVADMRHVSDWNLACEEIAAAIERGEG